MLDNEIYILREKLHSLILENANYRQILELSQELDEVIVRFTSQKLNDISSEK